MPCSPEIEPPSRAASAKSSSAASAARARPLVVVPRDHERRVQVAVARVAPAAGGKPVPPADLERLLDRLAKTIERDDDVLAHLAAALGGDGDRDSVPPAPQRSDRARRRSARRRRASPRPARRRARGAVARPLPSSRRPRRGRGTRRPPAARTETISPPPRASLRRGTRGRRRGARSRRRARSRHNPPSCPGRSRRPETQPPAPGSAGATRR